MPILIGNATVMVLGLLGAAGVVGTYVARHRKETWQLTDDIEVW